MPFDLDIYDTTSFDPLEENNDFELTSPSIDMDFEPPLTYRDSAYYDAPGQGGPLDAGFHQQQFQMGHIDLPYFQF
jgi:hypothetical protein